MRQDAAVDESRAVTNETPDAELVALTLAGQSRAFDRLIDRYQRRATSVAYRLLSDLHDALEVCQEAFLRAYRNLASLDDPERFGPWLLRIVTNQSLNYRRSRGSGPPRLSLEDCLIDDEQSSGEVLADDSPDGTVGQHLTADELSQTVQDAIAGLPPQQRLALILFSIEQLPQKEVAQIMECSVEAVKWHVFQARKKLRTQLAEYLEAG